MGKYMRKRRSIGVADGALGVRTRAKAMAESNINSLRLDSSRNVSQSSSLESRTRLTSSALRQHLDGLMVLRSRLIPKNAAETCLKATDNNLDACINHSPRLSVNGSRSTHTQEVAAPSLTRATRTVSSGVSVSLPTRQAYGILTRRRTQELANRVRQEYDPEVDFGVVSSAPKSSAYDCLKASAVDLNATACAAGSKSGTDASCTRTGCRRDGPSTSKLRDSGPIAEDGATFTNTAGPPSSSEIQAFFQDAEKERRERFIQRYNFDPTTGTPLEGRYEWICEESSCNG